MAKNNFDQNNLRKYLFEEMNFIPNDAMKILARLLFDELEKYCEECESDRMTCVLSPMCPERILLKVRLYSGAELKDLPQFCYQQYKNNIKRHIEKRTTLYKPQDNFLFNEDFFEVFFGKIAKKLIKAYKKNDTELLGFIIEDSNLPEVKLEFPMQDNLIFQKIIHKDKLIKKGTFVHHFSEDKRYLVVWFDSDLFVVDLKSGFTICNAKIEPLTDLKLVDIIFNIYGAEKNVAINTKINPEDKEQLSIEIDIPFDQINSENMNQDSTYFHELLEFLQKYYFKINVQHIEEPDDKFKISLQYSNRSIVQKRKSLLRLTYGSISELISLIANLKNKETL